MSRQHLLKWLGAGLAAIGGLSLLCACALLAWQYVSRLQTGKWIALPLRSMLGDAEWLGQNVVVTWVLERLHIGVPFALIGLGLLAIGVLVVRRENEIIRMQERAAADRLRRVRLGQYGDPAGRREPYMGEGAPEISARQRKAA
jgi:hypothetical protein